MSTDYRNLETRIVAINYNMPTKEDVSVLLDKCILLNSYFKNYFIPMEYISKYDICYQVNHYKDKQDMYLEAQTINFANVRDNLDNALFINELVYINTEAKGKEPDLNFGYYKYNKYDYTYTKLSNSFINRVILYDDKVLIFYNTDVNHPTVIKREENTEISASIENETDKLNAETKKNSLEPQKFKRVSLGGEERIRTSDTFRYTRFPSGHIRPL